MRQPHEVLGVPENATRAEIDEAYRRKLLYVNPNNFPMDSEEKLNIDAMRNEIIAAYKEIKEYSSAFSPALQQLDNAITTKRDLLIVLVFIPLMHSISASYVDYWLWRFLSISRILFFTFTVFILHYLYLLPSVLTRFLICKRYIQKIWLMILLGILFFPLGMILPVLISGSISASLDISISYLSSLLLRCMPDPLSSIMSNFIILRCGKINHKWFNFIKSCLLLQLLGLLILSIFKFNIWQLIGFMMRCG
jgi:hypothetical protein